MKKIYIKYIKSPVPCCNSVCCTVSVSVDGDNIWKKYDRAVKDSSYDSSGKVRSFFLL